MLKTQLRKDFNTGSFKVGASLFKQILWYLTRLIFFKSELVPSSALLVFLLRIFGSKIGKEVRIKPGVHIKYPWKLEIDDYCWIADCYIENLETVKLGRNCCISQQAMLITGSHDYKKTSFDLIIAPIILKDGVWIGAGAKVAPGVVCESHSVLTMSSLASHDLESHGIYQGNPAVKIRERHIS